MNFLTDAFGDEVEENGREDPPFPELPFRVPLAEKADGRFGRVQEALAAGAADARPRPREGVRGVGQGVVLVRGRHVVARLEGLRAQLVFVEGQYVFQARQIFKLGQTQSNLKLTAAGENWLEFCYDCRAFLVSHPLKRQEPAGKMMNLEELHHILSSLP